MTSLHFLFQITGEISRIELSAEDQSLHRQVSEEQKYLLRTQIKMING